MTTPEPTTTSNNQPQPLTTKTVVEVKTRLFPWEAVAVHSFEVTPDGKITVWDPKAKRYTANHSLTAGAKNRIKRIAGIRH